MKLYIKPCIIIIIISPFSFSLSLTISFSANSLIHTGGDEFLKDIATHRDVDQSGSRFDIGVAHDDHDVGVGGEDINESGEIRV